MIDTDDTRRAPPLHDDATAAVPDLTPTAASDPLAWSDTEPFDDVDSNRRTWRSTIWRAAVVLTVAAGIAAVIAAVFIHQARHAPTVWVPAPKPVPAAPAPAAPAPPPVVPTPVIVPPPIPAPPAPAQPPAARTRSGDDAFFLSHMHADAIPYGSGDDDAIASAHITCNSLADGTHSSLGDAAESAQRALGWTYQQSMDFVTDAVTAYCPAQAR